MSAQLVLWYGARLGPEYIGVLNESRFSLWAGGRYQAHLNLYTSVIAILDPRSFASMLCRHPWVICVYIKNKTSLHVHHRRFLVFVCRSFYTC